ncbi:MAG TPA: tripartite tricarboxylate transporter substrate binding protein [Burkholderiales bacterium]|nr:tripartite tricarboxylate transporter substrate binding protein [Burkholderiales bacterium]
MKIKAIVAGLALVATSAFAQYPNKPITIVVGFEPGGGTDTTARIVQGPLGEQVGQQIVVENRAGAGGNIAVDHVAKAAPDGYTIVLANVGALAVNPHILKTPYDPLKDLLPISMAAEFANVLVVQPSLQVNSVADFVKLAKAKPATITYASSGIGGAGHLSGELLRSMAKVDIVHVPYKGGGPAMQGFLGAQVDSFFATPISSISQIRAGKAKAVATTGSKRAALMPDVPTVAEQGYPGYEALNWYGFLAPRGTPKEIIDRLNREIVKALANQQVVAALHKTGTEPKSSTPEEFAAYIKREYDTWGKVVKEAGIKAQ